MRHKWPDAAGGASAFVPRDGEALYRWLTEQARDEAVDPFDRHVAASVLAIAFDESSAEASGFCAALGLEASQLHAMMAKIFPGARPALPPLGPNPGRSADEACLLDLLTRCASARTRLQLWLAAIIARRAQRPNHLWQDLGLANRGELSALMRRHFQPLAARNSQDMKWKKFLYRMICADASYSLCTAPSCRECDDFDHCFGEESGESFLARSRRAAEKGL